MKFRITTKYIKENYSRIISVGYNKIPTLLRNHNAIAYTAGIYGWNYDIYDIDGVAICTGHHGMPTKLSKNTKKYEETAMKFLDNYEATGYNAFDEVKIANFIEIILHKFIKEELGE